MTELIVALDVENYDEAIDVVAAIGEEVVWYKVGAILFTREGPFLVKVLKGMGKKIMLDLKYYDIPNTVRGAVKQAAALGVDMLTIHASGGRKMMEYAVGAVNGTDTKILAVTVLTSFTFNSWSESFAITDTSMAESVFRLAELAYNSGVHGIVCSPEETRLVIVGPRCDRNLGMFVVNPGIRPDWSMKTNDDQKRFTTPKQASLNGARYVVVGRPVLEHEDMRLAAQLINKELM